MLRVAEICLKCGRTIADTETAHVWRGFPVCEQCLASLKEIENEEQVSTTPYVLKYEIMGGIAGILLGELTPSFGGILQGIAQPFSPVRNEAAIAYGIVGVLLGHVTARIIVGRNKSQTRSRHVVKVYPSSHLRPLC
jgi:hypothetical protein